MTNPATLDKDILATLRNPDMSAAHELFASATTFVAKVSFLPPPVLRAVADALSTELQLGTWDAHEQAMLLAMVAFLAHESAGR